MNITELVRVLEDIKRGCGDIPVVVTGCGDYGCDDHEVEVAITIDNKVILD